MGFRQQLNCLVGFHEEEHHREVGETVNLDTGALYHLSYWVSRCKHCGNEYLLLEYHRRIAQEHLGRVQRILGKDWGATR